MNCYGLGSYPLSYSLLVFGSAYNLSSGTNVVAWLTYSANRNPQFLTLRS